MHTAIAFFIAAVVLSQLLLARDWRFLQIALTLAALLASVINFIALGRWEARLAKRLRQSDNLLCTHCGHTLPRTEDHGRCPECRIEYDRDSVQLAWQSLSWMPRE